VNCIGSFLIVGNPIGHFDVEKSSESGIRRTIHTKINKPRNLKHQRIATQFGLIVSSNWAELRIVCVSESLGSLEEGLKTSPSW
jgi:hypothetical protein